MRLIKLLLLTSIFAGAIAYAGVYRAAREIQALSRATPVADAPLATEKLFLEQCNRVRATVCSCTSSACTAQGGNLTGGNGRVWYDSPEESWSKNPDLDFTVGAPGSPCRTFLDIPGGRFGYIFVQSDAITLASGTNVRWTLECATDL